MDYEFYMNLAIDEAWKYQILTYPNPAVGCVICDKFGAILAVEAHKKFGSAHAELNAISTALLKLNPELKLPENATELYEFIIKNHSNLLKDAKAFVTLEPCSHHGKTPPCTELLKDLKFSEVIISQTDNNKIASGGANMLKEASIKVKFGVCQKAGKELLEPFLKWQKSGFSFYKLALSANGVISGGVITNLKSRTFSHQLRNVSERLIVGGNTVRIDRPTLDTRLIDGGKNPDVLIYSRNIEFDREIPLFSVPNRSVKIITNLDETLKGGLSMIEGGDGLLGAIYELPDWFLIFHSSEFLDRANLRSNLKFKSLYRRNLGDDSYGWYKLDK